VAEDLYLYANALSLAGLPEPGQYQLTFSIKDMVSKTKVERELLIEITD
jgi:hypothetical protein